MSDAVPWSAGRLARPAFLTLLASLNACGSAPPPSSRAGAVTDSLRIALDQPSSSRRGTPVRLTLRITNIADHPVTLSVMGRTIAFDLVVRSPDGRVVWRRLEGQSIPAILQIRTLAPGEALALSDTWTQRGGDRRAVPPGTYSVEGVLPTDAPEPLRAPPVPLVITP